MNVRKIHTIENPDIDSPTVAKQVTFRIAFVSKRIEPMGLPPFPYQPSALNYDSIEYVAILSAEGVVTAQTIIEGYWPEARFIYAHSGESFDFESSAMLVSTLGCVPAKPAPAPLKRGFWGTVKHFFVGTTPF